MRAPSPGRPAAGRRAAAALRWWLLATAYMALVFYLSAQENPLPQLSFRFWDKLLHACEYAALAGLLTLALRAGGRTSRWAVPLGIVLASAYGASDELHQAFVPGRSSDVRDWLADTVGAGLGAAAVGLALRLRRARASIGAAPQGG